MATNKRSDEAWVPTTCTGCFPQCGILVHRKNGKVIGSKGDPGAFTARGRSCGKSQARVAELYYPNRPVKPLKRTNPEKGIGVDPKWKEISWEEAMDTVVKQLDKVRKDDPRKLVIGSMDMGHILWESIFAQIYGTTNPLWGSATICGGGLHNVLSLLLGSPGNSEVDIERCNHVVLWGSQFGHGANNNPGPGVRHMADARKRGTKLKVVDPICGHAAGKADEWIPIIPGTDGALALCVCNLLLNEFGIYDADFLKKKTNAPYLVLEDGHYARDEETRKPLLWDPADGAAKPFDDSTVKDYALEGTYEVAGAKCRPAFDLLKEHLKKYPVEKVSKIAGVPEETILRLAKEFGEAAQVGATINWKGHTLPFRPAAIETKRGGTTHKNGFWNTFAITLPNILVGAIDTPGGLLGAGTTGPYGLWKPKPLSESMDGIITIGIGHLTDAIGLDQCYPPRKASRPDSMDLRGLMPCSYFRYAVPTYGIHDPEKFGIPYKPELLIIHRFNPMMSQMDPRAVAEDLKSFKFVISFVSGRIDETAEFADLIIPEAHDLERWWTFPANTFAAFLPPGPGPWSGQILQPVVEPPPGVRHVWDFMMDVVERLGLLADMNNMINVKFGLIYSEELKLKPEKKYTVEEIAKRTVGLITGKEYPEEWFRDHCSVELYERSVEEAFPVQFADTRIPLYLEHFIDAGAEVRKLTKELGMDWWDTSYYHPFPEWHPCPAHEVDAEEYDLYIANSKLPLHQWTVLVQNPWVDDISKRNHLDYHILLHTSAAEKKGIKDGDIIWVESETNRVKGRVRVTECVHPEVVGTFSTLGQWAKDKTHAKGKGVHFNSLIKFDWSMVDTLSGQLDYCAKVKVYKAEDNS